MAQFMTLPEAVAQNLSSADMAALERGGGLASHARALPGGEASHHRERLAITTKGSMQIVTELALWKPDPVTREFTVVSLYPGVTREMVQAKCGWTRRLAGKPEKTPRPTGLELSALRDPNARIKTAHSGERTGVAA